MVTKWTKRYYDPIFQILHHHKLYGIIKPTINVSLYHLCDMVITVAYIKKRKQQTNIINWLNDITLYCVCQHGLQNRKTNGHHVHESSTCIKHQNVLFIVIYFHTPMNFYSVGLNSIQNITNYFYSLSSLLEVALDKSVC